MNITEILEKLVSGYDYRYPNAKAHKEALEQAETKLQALLESAVPDINKHYCPFNDGEQTCPCFKEAIDTMINNLKGKK